MSYSELIMNLVGESPEKTRKSTLLAYLDGHRDARHAAAEIAAEADARIEVAQRMADALRDLFGADMAHVMAGDGKDDQMKAVADARAALAEWETTR